VETAKERGPASFGNLLSSTQAPIARALRRRAARGSMQFAQFQPGQHFTTASYLVTEEAIIHFAKQFDRQPFHTDPVAARSSRWGGIIASGFHTCAITMRLITDAFLADSDSCGSPGIEYLKWPRPVRAGDEVHAIVSVLSVNPSRGGTLGVVRWEWRLLNQSQLPVLELVAVSLFGPFESTDHLIER
jgi:acyl dehydratase